MKRVRNTLEPIEPSSDVLEKVIQSSSDGESLNIENDAISDDNSVPDSDPDVSDDDSVYASEDFAPPEDLLEDSSIPLSKYENLAELSDSSEEEQPPLVRMGNIPREWYDDLDHLGYNVDGVPITKRSSTMDAIDKFLAMRNNGEYRRTVYDDLNDKDVVLTAKDLQMIHRLRHGTYANADFNPEDGPYLQAPTQKHPISGNFLNPAKRSFVPSKHENQRVLYLVKALRNGWIRPKVERDEEEEDKDQMMRDLWNDGQVMDKSKGPAFIPAPKLKTPGHAESYNPPEEYLLDEEEQKQWLEKSQEERTLDFIPKKFNALRKVPGYSEFIRERFERCLDLYLCPRAMRQRLQIDPESLIPKLPNPASLKPFPTFESIPFIGHKDRVQALSVSPCGQWLASGDDSGEVCVWEIASGRCMHKVEVGSEEEKVVRQVEWNPKMPGLIGIAVGNRLVFLQVWEEDSVLSLESVESPGVKMHKTVRNEEGYLVSSIEIMRGLVSGFVWHRSGDFVATFRDSESSKSAVMVHKLSSGESQQPFAKSKGFVQAICFHPSRPLFFVATKGHVRVYDLSQQTLVKKLKAPVQWISSMDIHPQTGDHVLLGSYDRKVCWFDLDLSSKPFKTMKYHKAAVRSVKFHSAFPLFLSASDDGKIHVFHGRVYNDLMTDPQIVPVKVLQSHATDTTGLGVLNGVWHPTQPWLFTSGSDGLVKMFR